MTKNKKSTPKPLFLTNLIMFFITLFIAFIGVDYFLSLGQLNIFINNVDFSTIENILMGVFILAISLFLLFRIHCNQKPTIVKNNIRKTPWAIAIFIGGLTLSISLHLLSGYNINAIVGAGNHTLVTFWDRLPILLSLFVGYFVFYAGLEFFLSALLIKNR